MTWRGVYALLFRFLGFGFRLAMSNVGWHVTQKFVNLVPDPIGFAPWSGACSIQASLVTSVTTHLPGLSLRGLLSHQRTKTTWATAFPRINCLTNTATVLTATATVTSRFLLSISFHKVPWRQKQLSDFVETKKYRTLPKSCGSQSSEWEERKFVHVVDLARQSRAVVFAWWNPCIIRPCCAADGWSWRSRTRRGGPREARFVILARGATLILFYLLVFSLFPCEQAIIARSRSETPGVRRCRCACVVQFSCHVRHVSRKVFSFCMHVDGFLFFSPLAFHSRSLLSPSTCGGLLFRDFITTCSARGFVAGVHGDRCAWCT